MTGPSNISCVILQSLALSVHQRLKAINAAPGRARRSAPHTGSLCRQFHADPAQDDPYGVLESRSAPHVLGVIGRCLGRGSGREAGQR